MSPSSADSTPIALLEGVSREPLDQAAWAEFVRRYGPKVYHWCRRWGLQEADAEDVTQVVLTKLADKMRDFRYDPAGKFRAYLRTLTHYAWCDLLESRRRAGAGTGDSEVLKALQAVEARADLAVHQGDMFDQEVFEEAIRRVRQRVEPHTWEAFRLTALEGQPGAVAAAQLAMKEATVFKARSKVQKMLQQEVAVLDPPIDAGSEGRP